LLARPEEAAELLGVGRSTIYELMREGELPVVHIGCAARIPVEELRQWVEAHETPKPPTH
jgi:excisionase family DNA binding protein